MYPLPLAFTIIPPAAPSFRFSLLIGLFIQGDIYGDIITFAYIYTLKPPKTMKVHPNVMICYCTDACDFSKPITKSRWRGCREFVENYKKWKEIANKVYIWDYSANFKYLFQPFECCHVMPGNFRYFREMGALGVFEEGNHYGVKCVDEALKTWIIGHLLWNPDQPLEPLLDRFFRGYYGAAADVARGYYDGLVELERKRDETREPLVMMGTKDILEVLQYTLKIQQQELQ